MMTHGKILAAAAVPVMAAGVALTAGGSAHAASQTAPVPIGYTVTAVNAYSDSISGVTATFGTPATSVVGSAAVQVPTADAIAVRRDRQPGRGDHLVVQRPARRVQPDERGRALARDDAGDGSRHVHGEGDPRLGRGVRDRERRRGRGRVSG